MGCARTHARTHASIVRVPPLHYCFIVFYGAFVESNAGSDGRCLIKRHARCLH